MEVYAAPPEVFVALMMLEVLRTLATGELPDAWLVNLQRNIPTWLAAEAVDEMRPMALQNVVWKWPAPTILVVVEDASQVAIPPLQILQTFGKSWA